MARPFRLKFAGALYHHAPVRANRREAIFDDGTDHTQFLSLLGDVVALFNRGVVRLLLDEQA